MDPLQWMGAVRMRDQTADKNITIIHKYSTYSSPSINVLRREKLRVCKKQIHQDILTSIHCFRLKYESIIIIKLPLQWKSIWLRFIMYVKHILYFSHSLSLTDTHSFTHMKTYALMLVSAALTTLSFNFLNQVLNLHRSSTVYKSKC